MPRIWPHTSAQGRPARRLPAWVLVALLHLALLMSMWKLPVWSDRGGTTPEAAPLVVTLWQKARPAAPPVDNPAAAAKRASLPVPTQPALQAITLPADAAAPAPSGPAASPESSAPDPRPSAGPAALPPLNLSLPRGASAPWRQRNPALDDPRSNTAKLTMEQKLANAMGGDGTWQMERLDNDHIRYRRGDECVLVTRSRAGQLELGNGAFRNAWMVGNC